MPIKGAAKADVATRRGEGMKVLLDIDITTGEGEKPTLAQIDDFVVSRFLSSAIAYDDERWDITVKEVNPHP